MPSTSPAQHRLMEAVAHNPSFAKKAGIPQSVGKDFAKADDKAGITKTHKGKPVKHKFGQPHTYKRMKSGSNSGGIGGVSGGGAAGGGS